MKGDGIVEEKNIMGCNHRAEYFNYSGQSAVSISSGGTDTRKRASKKTSIRNVYDGLW